MMLVLGGGGWKEWEMAESLVPTACRRSTGELHTSQQAHIIASVLRDCMFVLFAARDGAGGGVLPSCEIMPGFGFIGLPFLYMIFFSDKDCTSSPKADRCKEKPISWPQQIVDVLGT